MRIIPFATPIHDPIAVRNILETINNLIKEHIGSELKLDQLRTSPLNEK